MTSRLKTVLTILFALVVAQPSLADDAEEKGAVYEFLKTNIKIDGNKFKTTRQAKLHILNARGEEQAEFYAALGLGESAQTRFIQGAFDLLDLITMFTVGPDECRAWSIRRGSTAPRAAGKIHSDMERGFIRAEVIHWRDHVELGSESKCREAGKLRVEGRDYIVQDGDDVHFRFNV